MNTLPCGIMPADNGIEIFADPENFGKCFYISNGTTRSFWELPLDVLDDLRDELSSDTRALKGLHLMGLSTEAQMLEQYNYCNRGMLDNVPDILPNGKKTKEYVNCSHRGRCAGEDKVCSPVCIKGEHITHREFECLKHIGTGHTYKEITVEMGFRRETAVNSLIYRLRYKLNCRNNVEIALKCKDFGIV